MGHLWRICDPDPVPVELLKTLAVNVPPRTALTRKTEVPKASLSSAYVRASSLGVRP